jgi:hypothetical protein
MRSGNLMDGTYFFLIFVPVLLSIWAGYHLRKRIVYNLLAGHHLGQNLSLFMGISLQILILTIGILSGYILIRLF